MSTEGGEYEEGTEVTITATPDEGYDLQLGLMDLKKSQLRLY